MSRSKPLTPEQCAIKPGDLVVSKKYPWSYLWRVQAIHPARPETFNKPTIDIKNLGTQHPPADPARLGAEYCWLLEDVVPYPGYRVPRQEWLL